MTDRANEGMAEFWNGKGGENWISREARLEASLKLFGQRAMAAAAITRGQRILDIGFGCGDTSIELAETVGPTGHVHGVDISATMVAAAEKQAKKAACDNVSFECADAQTHTLTGACYDRIFSRFGVMFFDDPVGAFKNMHGALKPGGCLAFISWAPRDSNAWVGLPLQVVAQHLSLPPAPSIDDPGPFSLSEPSRITTLLGAAGFSHIAVESVKIPFVLGADIDEALSFLMHLAPSGGAINNAEADTPTRQRIGADMATMLQSHCSEEGVSMKAEALLVTASQ